MLAGAQVLFHVNAALTAPAFHGLAGEIVARILPNTESDPAALLLQYLVSFGNAVGRQPYYLVKEHSTSPTFTPC